MGNMEKCRTPEWQLHLILLKTLFGPNYEHFFFPSTVAYSVSVIFCWSGWKWWMTKHLGRCARVDMCRAVKWTSLTTSEDQLLILNSYLHGSKLLQPWTKVSSSYKRETGWMPGYIALQFTPLQFQLVWPTFLKYLLYFKHPKLSSKRCVGLYAQRVGHLLDLFKHAERLGYLAPLVLVTGRRPTSSNHVWLISEWLELFLFIGTVWTCLNDFSIYPNGTY